MGRPAVGCCYLSAVAAGCRGERVHRGLGWCCLRTTARRRPGCIALPGQDFMEKRTGWLMEMASWLDEGAQPGAYGSMGSAAVKLEMEIRLG